MKLTLIIMSGICLASVSSYGFKGHSFLGSLAEKYLDTNTSIKIKEIMQENSFEKASVWADSIKRQSKYSWTKELHYIDIDRVECENPVPLSYSVLDKYCKGEICNVYAIQNFLSNMTYNYELSEAEKLKFVLHFIQDFNQPFHLIGDFRGGNDYKVSVLKDERNKTTNLHFLWDTDMPEYYIKNYNYNYTIQHDNSMNLRDLLLNILNTNFKIACKVFPENHYIIFAEYFKEEYMKTLFDNYITLLFKVFNS